MIVPDSERWKRISPLLDGLLELGPGARAERLASLGAHDPGLARELSSLIADADRAEAAQFLTGSAVPPAPAQAHPATGLAGMTIGAYVLEAEIGEGGMGAVWRARRADGRFEGRVAVKLLHLSLVGRTGSRRFEREGAILARLSHPNIARLLDAGVTAGGQPYLVLELVEGERIDVYCDARRLPVAERIALFRQVLDAVAHAHHHLVIHRDIKPSNILVSADGSVKLLDFGIAKLLEGDGGEAATDLTGARRGALTPEYAAPEQLRGDQVTTATDVYSLGVLLYQLLSGQHPTAPPGATPADLIRGTLDTDPDRLASAVTSSHGAPAAASERIAAERDTSIVRLKRQLGGDLENIVAKALRKTAGDRYATVDAFDEDLRRWSRSEPVTARPDSLSYRSARFVNRHRGAVAAGALTGAAIVVGLIGTISQAHRAQQQSERATHEAEIARQERDEALQQQRLQRGTNEFLQLLMRDSAGRDPGAIRKQLDRAMVLIEQTRFEHPVVKVSLLRQTAGRYAELGDIDAATGAMRKAIAAIAGTDLALPTSAVPVNLACSLARYLHEANDLAGAVAELDGADRLIAAGAQVAAPSRAECDVQRSYLATDLGRHDDAVALLRKVQGNLSAAGVVEGEQPRVVRSALSRALAAGGDNVGAMAIARPLLAESVTGQGRESIAVLRRSSVVTEITRAGGDPQAALPLAESDKAVAAQLQGADHVDAAIELELGRVLLELGRYADAAVTLDRSARAAASANSLTYVLPASLAASEALVRAGRVQEGADRLVALAPLIEKATPARRIDALRVAAALAAARGDADEDRRQLEAAARLIESAGGSPAQVFAVAAAQAARALADGRVDDAGASVERALAAARRTALVAERSSDIGRALLLRARLLQATGRAGDAEEVARAAREQLLPTLGPSHPDTLAAAKLGAG